MKIKLILAIFGFILIGILFFIIGFTLLVALLLLFPIFFIFWSLKVYILQRKIKKEVKQEQNG